MKQNLRKIRDRELLWGARCTCCNYSNNLELNDPLLTGYLGNNKKTRVMYLDDSDDIICTYCAYPDKQFQELNQKSKKTLASLGDFEVELAKWNNLLAEEGLKEIK